jgi:signal transduction histidine kinase/DNA-binding NarL/FixJ family response regulator
MPEIFLTPASISYLAQSILAFVLAVYMGWYWFAREEKLTHLPAIFASLVSIFLFSVLLFFDAALLPGPRLVAVYLQNTVLALGLFFLLYFAYHYPRRYDVRKWEIRSLLAFAALYAAYEAQYALSRIVDLWQNNTVNYRIAEADYVLAGLFLCLPLVFLRQAVLADKSARRWWTKITRPEGVSANAARTMGLLFLLPVALGLINLLRTQSLISTTFYNLALSLGILFGLWLLLVTYTNSLPQAASFLFKASVLNLAFVFVVLGSIGWVVAPAYARFYHPPLEAHQSLRFTPNPQGGYDIVQIPAYFEEDLGQPLPVTSRGQGRNAKVDFEFPFYGVVYPSVYPSSVGLIRLDEALYHPNLQKDYGRFPGIFPLLVDLEPDSGGDVFVRAGDGRLVVTWYQLPAVHQPESVFTFQAVLYASGQFDLNYRDLPDNFVFAPDSRPSSNIWLRGITPGGPDAVPISPDLAKSAQAGPQGLLQDYNLVFRAYLHELYLPLGWAFPFISVLTFVAISLAFYAGFARPLNNLLTGMTEVDRGNLDVVVPIRAFDEIGRLTQSFNDMVTWLRTIVNSLESRVAERTAELELSNLYLQKEIELRQAADAQLIEQQRSLAVMNERECLGSDLQDGLLQALGGINVQVLAAQSLLERGEIESASASLQGALKTSQQISAEMRQFIMGLSERVLPEESGFFNILQNYLREYQQVTGIQASLSLPPDKDFPVLTPAAEEQMMRILQEALANIRKHARANRAEILFSPDDRRILVTVLDDGLGFDPSQTRSGGGYAGLGMMRERAEILGGHMEIHSAPGRGAKLLFFIPILNNASLPDDARNLADLRLLLADESDIFLEGLRSLLQSRGIPVVDTASDGLEVQRKVRQLRPDMVVMNTELPNPDGLQLTRAIKDEFPATIVVLLTTAPNDEALLDALKNGASGFLRKDIDANEFCDVLERLARGETILSSDLALRIVEEMSRTRPLGEEGKPGFLAGDKLSPMQSRILAMVASQLTYKEIGVRLHLSEATIKYHVRQILNRLDLRKRADLVSYYRKSRAAPDLKEPDF